MSICIIIFICERLYFWELVSYSILYILVSTVKADESILAEVTVKVSVFPVALRSPDPQVPIVSL